MNVFCFSRRGWTYVGNMFADILKIQILYDKWQEKKFMSISKKYRQVINMDMVRFHVDFGPPSLFERVRYKMKDVHHLYMDGKHFNKRKSERNIPDTVIEKLQHFDINEWTLKTAEVRPDRGKFMNSTWEVICFDKPYWVTIGIGNYIITIVQRNSSGIDLCIREGDFYNFVEETNLRLMEEESLVSN